VSTTDWSALRKTDLLPLRQARMQAYFAVQWLARAARAYIPPQPDDGHTNLGWDEGFEGFITHPLENGIRIALRIRDLTLALVKDGITQSFQLNGRTEAEVRAWLGKEMQSLRLQAAALDAALPYELPSHPLANGAPYHAASLAEPLSGLAAWYAGAYSALESVRRRLLMRGLPAPEVRCWPHHFDLDCLTTVAKGSAGTTSTMGAGFSPGDHYYDEPYFYISLYPRPDPALLPALDAPGHWHRQDFLAAVASATEILALKDPQAETEAFLQSASDQIMNVLKESAKLPVT
jgi:hypothetical protein